MTYETREITDFNSLLTEVMIDAHNASFFNFVESGMNVTFDTGNDEIDVDPGVAYFTHRGRLTFV